MRARQRIGQIERKLDDATARQTSLRGQHIPQRAVAHIPDNQVMLSLFLNSGDHPHDVGMMLI